MQCTDRKLYATVIESFLVIFNRFNPLMSNITMRWYSVKNEKEIIENLDGPVKQSCTDRICHYLVKHNDCHSNHSLINESS